MFHNYGKNLIAQGFITGKSESLEELLEFGFWQTEMCRWLEKYAECLLQELSDLLTEIRNESS